METKLTTYPTNTSRLRSASLLLFILLMAIFLSHAQLRMMMMMMMKDQLGTLKQSNLK